LNTDSRGSRVLRFIETYCLVPEGVHVGKPIRLMDFQKKFILDIYDNPNGTRRALMAVARKNGKSALVSCLLLAHIVGPEAQQNSQIVSGAMSRDQAALVFALASKMLNMQPKFEGLYKCIPSGKRIYGLRKNVEYKALAADGTTAHGLSPVLAILDEVGQIKGPMTPFVEAIVTSQGAHENPLLIAISTQASTDADMFSTWLDDAERSGDPHCVYRVYAADKDCDLMDREQWRKANPALGVFRSEKDLEEQLKQAARIPSMEASARLLLLNQRIALESLWLSPSVWKANRAEPDLDVFRRFPVSVGLDLSVRNDLTAAVFSCQDDSGFIHLLPLVFCPTSGLKERELRDKSPYSSWAKEGKLVLCPGSTLDYDWLSKYLQVWCEEREIRADVLHFDRWRIREFKSSADRNGFATDTLWKEFGQGYQSMSPAIEFFESMVLQDKVKHGSHPLLNMAASNAIAIKDPAGNRKLDKSKSTLRIDPLVAAVMSVSSFTSNVDQFDAAALIG